ncbi:hypothetical protein J7E99_02720 [Streptomyces sp. ISL-44]|uniref:hypothetical protein n=1 Tax=Streptomyces sp. ISL-44 TaxID=2819184 RepID=UPI001BEC2B02|nr:hypothetical protein [Streptomyces sp. ISL-44]MBT2539650.1 hypothetical protein [Streptomyces sp. ISL-44]
MVRPVVASGQRRPQGFGQGDEQSAGEPRTSAGSGPVEGLPGLRGIVGDGLPRAQQPVVLQLGPQARVRGPRGAGQSGLTPCLPCGTEPGLDRTALCAP